MTNKTTATDRSKHLDFITIYQDLLEIPLYLTIDGNEGKYFDLQFLQGILDRAALW